MSEEKKVKKLGSFIEDSKKYKLSLAQRSQLSVAGQSLSKIKEELTGKEIKAFIGDRAITAVSLGLV